MVSESSDVKQFFSSHPVFQHLDEENIKNICHNTLTAFAKSGKDLVLNESTNTQNPVGLILVRSGSLEIRTHENELKDRLSSGDFLFPLLLSTHENKYKVLVLEDCLYYEISDFTFQKILAIDSQILKLRDAWERAYSNKTGQSPDTRLQKPKSANDIKYQANPLSMYSVRDYMCSPAICTGPGTSIQQAAQLMRNKKISSLLITDAGKVCGILTDRDLRNRVIAEALPLSDAVSKVMTRNPACIEADRRLHDAQLLMMSEGIHHLPVMEKTAPAGIISLSDLLNASNAEPLALIGAINNSKSVHELSLALRKLPELVAKLIERDTRAVEIGEIITSFTDGLTRRLLVLAAEELGPPPCDYAWLAFGSQARQEQMLGSDQDNAIILERSTNKDESLYFEKFTRFVNSGLDKCGIPLCPGNIMASNPKWRNTLNGWKKHFDVWIEQPSPKALMHASIFFDMRYIAGNEKYISSLQSHVLKKARTNTIFLALMSDNSLQHSPPLGFFKTFVLERDGDHINSLDLKKRGTIPIVDIARNYSLSEGVTEVNTISRLHALEKSGAISKELVNSLVDAHEFIAGIRLEAQGEEYRSGKQIDNFLDPKELSTLVRHQLKEAFQLVREAQTAMKLRFGGGVL